MPARDPVVSIVMPTYNSAEPLLRKAIGSVFEQTLKDWELIIVDDASTNDTPRILDEIAKSDPRVQVIHKERNEFRELGIAGSLNRGIDLARGKYIARLDHDDYWIESRKLEKQVAYMEAHADCAVTGGGMVVVSPDGAELNRYLKNETDAQIRRRALFSNPFSHTTVLFRKDIAVEVGKYQGKHVEDWDLWLRMGTRGTFYNFPEYFVAYTVTGVNSSFLNQRALTGKVLALLRWQRGHYPGFFAAYTLNLFQYMYAIVPIPRSLRVRMHASLVWLKRKFF